MVPLPLEREAAMIHDYGVPVRPLHNGTVVVNLRTPGNDRLPSLVVLGENHEELVFKTSNRLLEHFEEASILGETSASPFDFER
jgi:hypothetical protein